MTMFRKTLSFATVIKFIVVKNLAIITQGQYL